MPKLFHALRSSRETELAGEFPIHVVTAWLGNTPTIALRHYLLTTDADFEKAASNPVQNPVQCGTETRSTDSQAESENLVIAAESDEVRVSAETVSWGTRIRT